MRGRVDGEDAGVCTASYIPIHPTSALVDGSLEGFRFPAVQECSIEAVSGIVAVREDEGLLRVQSILCEGVELGGVPVDLDLDFGEGDGVFRICTLSVGCEGNVGLVVTGVNILQKGRVNVRREACDRYAYLSVPAAREGLLDVSPFSADECGDRTYGLGSKPAWALERREMIVTRGLDQWV